MTIDPPVLASSSVTEHNTDVAIVGGGMMGTTLALMIAKALPSARVTVIEAHSPAPKNNVLPSFDERSTAVSPTTQSALSDLGLWSGLLPYAADITNIHVSDQGQVGIASLGPQDNRNSPLGYVVQNSGFGRVLLEALGRSKVQLLAPCRVDAADSIRGGVRLSLSNAQVLTTRLLIVADGADSPIRKQLGIGVHVHEYQQHAVVANVAFSRAHNSCAYERFTKNGPIALLPLGKSSNNQASLVWTWPSDQIDRVRGMCEQELLSELQRQFGHRLGEFYRIGSLSYYPLTLRIAKEQVRSNIVLMGNAAHFLHPVAGQGFNLAVRDGLRLVDVIKHSGPESLGRLESLMVYVSEQQKDQSRTILMSHSFNQVFRRSGACVPHLRSLGFLLMNAFEPLKQQVILQLSGKASPRAQPWV